jgi:hypothetical protein
MMRLHLGCFDRPVLGWVNTDITPHLRVARVPGAAKALHAAGFLTDERYQQHVRGLWRQVTRLDVSKPFPFPDESVEAIYSSHLLEHLPPIVARNCLGESFRVLGPSGVIRVGVPDLDLYVEQYDPTDPDTFVFRVFEAEHARDKNKHQWMYNETSLREVLRQAGFLESVRREAGKGDCPDLELLDNRPDITLFMEATKA